MLKARALHDDFGVEVLGVNLAEPVPVDLHDALYAALCRYGVLLSVRCLSHIPLRFPQLQ